MFSTQEDPSRTLALTTSLQHSAELPTFLTPQLPELLQDFFSFCILRPLRKFISPAGHQYLTMLVILALSSVKHLEEILVYACLLSKHQSFDPMSINTLQFTKAVITAGEKNTCNEEIQN